MDLQEAKEALDSLHPQKASAQGTYKVIADLHRQLWGMLKGQIQ